MIEDLEAKVEAHHQGGLKSKQVSIREGIYDSSIQKDIERQGALRIPENFADLKGVTTSKTSLRKPSDYPVLQERFKDMS